MFGRIWNNWNNYQGTQSKPSKPEELLKHLEELKQVVYPAVLHKSKCQTTKKGTQFAKDHPVDQPLQPGTKVMIRQVDKAPGNTEYAGLYSVLRLNKGGAYVLLDPTGQEFPHKVPRKHLKVIELPKVPAPSPAPQDQDDQDDQEY